MLSLYSLACVGSGRKPKLLVFSAHYFGRDYFTFFLLQELIFRAMLSKPIVSTHEYETAALFVEVLENTTVGNTFIVAQLIYPVPSPILNLGNLNVCRNLKSRKTQSCLSES